MEGGVLLKFGVVILIDLSYKMNDL